MKRSGFLLTFMLAGVIFAIEDVQSDSAEATLELDLMEFFPRAQLLAQTWPSAKEDLQILCQENVDGQFVSFVGFEEVLDKQIDEIILLAVFSEQEFRKPEKNMYSEAPQGGIPPGGTRDWGWVFDRNSDGRVDYLAFLDGPNPVVPDEPEDDLPNLTQPITRNELLLVAENMRYVFWHAADDNFDGHVDGLAVSMRNLKTGWIEGWMVAQDKDFDNRYELCNYFQRTLQSKPEKCGGSADGYHVPGKALSGLYKVPPIGWDNLFLPEINAAAETCQLSGASFRQE
jgi:hypothetical protein